MTDPVRRIVTGNDAEGRSSIVEDGPPPAVITVQERPGYVVSNIWVTGETPAAVDRPDASFLLRLARSRIKSLASW